MIHLPDLPEAMGNKCANLDYAEWEDGTKCSHGNNLSAYRVTEIRWIRVPMSSGFMRGTTQVGRVVFGVATLGTTAWLNGGIKDLSHECIEILTTCKYCGHSTRFTAEIIQENDTNFRCGYYSREYNARHTSKPSSMTLDYVKAKYDEMGSHYGVFFDNCSHWCSELWNKL